MRDLEHKNLRAPWLLGLCSCPGHHTSSWQSQPKWSPTSIPSIFPTSLLISLLNSQNHYSPACLLRVHHTLKIKARLPGRTLQSLQLWLLLTSLSSLPIQSGFHSCHSLLLEQSSPYFSSYLHLIFQLSLGKKDLAVDQERGWIIVTGWLCVQLCQLLEEVA